MVGSCNFFSFSQNEKPVRSRFFPLKSTQINTLLVPFMDREFQFCSIDHNKTWNLTTIMANCYAFGAFISFAPRVFSMVLAWVECFSGDRF